MASDLNTSINNLSGIEKLLAVMVRLRDAKQGCPWDVAQSFGTITKYTLEEVYEVVEAIERQDYKGLKEELGDLLFQIVFYAQMGAEKSLFDFHGIAQSTADKMIERHPHVFNGMKLEDVDALTRLWEADKADKREKQAAEQGKPPSLLDDVPTALPALTRAVKLQSRAARGGFEWKDIAPVMAKLNEELAELQEVIAEKEKACEPLPLDVVDRLTEELGDVLFVAANIGRVLKIDPELALRSANRKFERRFQGVEQALAAKGRKPQEATLQEMADLWDEMKKKNA